MQTIRIGSQKREGRSGRAVKRGKPRRKLRRRRRKRLLFRATIARPGENAIVTSGFATAIATLKRSISTAYENSSGTRSVASRP